MNIGVVGILVIFAVFIVLHRDQSPPVLFRPENSSRLSIRSFGENEWRRKPGVAQGTAAEPENRGLRIQARRFRGNGPPARFGRSPEKSRKSRGLRAQAGLTAIGKTVTARSPHPSRSASPFGRRAGRAPRCSPRPAGPFRPILRPPAEIREIEGLRLASPDPGGRAARAKFAFAVAPPRSGPAGSFRRPRPVGFDVPHPRGRGLSRPSFGKSLLARRTGTRSSKNSSDFPFARPKSPGLITGRWSDEAAEDWTLRPRRPRPDRFRERGAIFRSGSWSSFPESDLPRRWSFRQCRDGRVVGLLDAAFNRPDPEFSLDFLRTFASKTWPEIERLLR